MSWFQFHIYKLCIIIYMYHCSIDCCFELNIRDGNFCENCSHFTLKWFQPNSYGEMCFLGESQEGSYIQIDVRYSNFEHFNGTYMKMGSMPLQCICIGSLRWPDRYFIYSICNSLQLRSYHDRYILIDLYVWVWLLNKSCSNLDGLKFKS